MYVCLALIKQNSPTPGEDPAQNPATFPYMMQCPTQCKGTEMSRQFHRLAEILGWPLERSLLPYSPAEPNQTLRLASLQSTREPGYYSMHIQIAKTDL